VKTKPISFRPSKGLDSRLEAMRRRTGIPKSRLAEQLIDEGERMRRYPGISFHGPDHDRAAWVIGTHLDIWEVILGWQDFGEDTRRVQDYFQISSHQLNLALAYYREFKDEIDNALALQRRPLSELEKEYPFAQVVRAEE
jgi:hypothetical protein